MAESQEKKKSSSTSLSVSEQGNDINEEEEGEIQRSAKRNREQGEEARELGEGDSHQSPKRSRINGSSSTSSISCSSFHESVVFRIVVPCWQIGRVIGKQGSRISQIRQHTKANIKIADSISRNEDRAIIISSTNEDNVISEAEKALYHIASVILMETDEYSEPPGIGEAHLVAKTIRLLIAGSQAGCLIGKSGQNIAKIRNLSGATITIMAQNQLPLCASAHESDRVVQISGEVPEVLKSLELIGCELRENPAKKVISIRPVSNSKSNALIQSPGIHLVPNYSISPVVVAPAAPPAHAPGSDMMMEMTILEALAGGFIGKGGSNISRIRNVSGATIKISGPTRDKDHRVIHLSGSSQAVDLARKLVDEYLASQTL
ncbi:hypothetical protein C5167_030040 [Papaver somniferum]|uniref:RNA-binding KH domain-containing protein PEPPER-like n=1 Tax=Papaver somniferum TaxID=3469 RepID=UPI000E6FF28B|nr:RNA-binding KH domain-containing protein PEPPER-like [Papaver somniferum]RZC86689.1 hypothetical protein C5167_030040 [Papaver somniferum]